MKRVYIAALLAAISLSACSIKPANQTLSDMAAGDIQTEAVMVEAPAPVLASSSEKIALDTGSCASDGIGGTGCPAID